MFVPRMHFSTANYGLSIHELTVRLKTKSSYLNIAPLEHSQLVPQLVLYFGPNNPKKRALNFQSVH